MWRLWRRWLRDALMWSTWIWWRTLATQYSPMRRCTSSSVPSSQFGFQNCRHSMVLTSPTIRPWSISCAQLSNPRWTKRWAKVAIWQRFQKREHQLSRVAIRLLWTRASRLRVARRNSNSTRRPIGSTTHPRAWSRGSSRVTQRATDLSGMRICEVSID